MMLFALGSAAQPLVLVSGKKKKVIEPGTWIAVSGSFAKETPNQECMCPSWIGKYTGMQDQKLQIAVRHAWEYDHDENGQGMIHETSYSDPGSLPVIGLDINDLVMIQNQGSKKEPREIRMVQNIAGVLMIMSLGTLSAAAFAEDAETLVVAGLAEFVTGLVFFSTLGRKDAYLKPDENNPRKKRIWQIENR